MLTEHPAFESTLETRRLILRQPDESMVVEATDYLRRNRAHFAASGPKLESEPSEQSTLASIREGCAELARAVGVRFYVFARGGHPRRLIGNVSLSNIVRGVFLACHLGYRIDAEYQGRGLMTEAVERCVEHAFDGLGLHRVMANYVPTNERSARLLRRLGFVVEGYARDYLLLNGTWQDHILTARVRPAQGER